MSAVDPEIEEHLTRCADLRRLAYDFKDSFVNRADWSIVLQFYAALHLADAYLKMRNPGYAPTSHKDRDDAIWSKDGLTGLPEEARKEYYKLKDLSRQVRYESVFHAQPANFKSARNWLNKVVSVLRPLLQEEGYDLPH